MTGSVNIDIERVKTSNEAVLNPRIIQYHGKRYSLRLEDNFWAVLEAEAQARDCRLNQLVHEYFNHPGAGDNKTAFLRRRAVEWLSENLINAQNQLQMERSEIGCILKASSQPAILFTDDFQISRYNKAFRKWLLRQIEDCDETLLRKLRVNFRSSFNSLNLRIAENNGMVADEQAAVLIPGYAIPVKMNTIRIKNYLGKPAFMGIINK